MTLFIVGALFAILGGAIITAVQTAPTWGARFSYFFGGLALLCVGLGMIGRALTLGVI